MIRKQDILDRAAEWGLRADVVEKDYVLGWLLAALASHPARDLWVFKGGTCIKKCYFETYRFSEDLDFSLLPAAPYNEHAIGETLIELARRTSELSGIEFPADRVVVRSQRNKQGLPTFRGSIAYRGPLGIATFPRVLFDITQHEPLLDDTAERPIFHPYPDDVPEHSIVLAYSFDELMAEKLRALLERSRPRDLYDVVYLLENSPGSFDLSRARTLFGGKCSVKGLVPPAAADIVRIVVAEAELRSEWANMLGHQLPALPSLDDLLDRLPPLLAWIDESGELSVAPLEVYPTGADQELEAPIGMRFWGGGIPLEAVRFAGANRLLVEFDYHGRHREVEPYSLRRGRTTGNLNLYAFELGAGQIKAFNVQKMGAVRATSTTFQPRYQIELSPGGPIVAPPAARPLRLVHAAPRIRRMRTHTGPRYIFECSHCHKRFQHAKNDSKLRRHKDPSGFQCSGRRGYLVDTRW